MNQNFTNPSPNRIKILLVPLCIAALFFMFIAGKDSDTDLEKTIHVIKVSPEFSGLKGTKHYIKKNNIPGPGIPVEGDSKVYHITIVPSESDGGILNITGLGIREINNVQVSILKQTGDPEKCPDISLKSINSKSVSYNLTEVINGEKVFVAKPKECVLYFQITGEE
jgi:hypothetical protein